MKASLRWLRELCPQLPDDAAAVAARLTSAGVEVEGLHAFGLGAEACLVARVVSMRPHPSRSGLRLVTVQGAAGEQEVVCGAPNVPDPGGLVVLAPLGAHLPAKGMTIEKRTIAGVPSEGMLCSEAELGLGDDGSGILVLPPGTAAPGARFAQVLPGARDTIFEIGLTPNRADCLGHVGLAREAAALFDVPFAVPAVAPPSAVRDEDLAAYVSVTIEDTERCPHYGAAALVEVRVGPSSLAARWRLASLGVRPISNVVDVTNLVMLESGHPMHAFDLDRVRGRAIVVRRATEGEKLVTLDGVERTLTADDLVVCDGEGPVALAGVMGGGNSEISDTTSRVLLECAMFEPRGVRRASRRHALHTESSHRFERGVDWADTTWSLGRAVSLVLGAAGGLAVREQRVFEGRAQARRTVSLRHGRIAALLGFDVPEERAGGILERLGFGRRATQPGLDVWDVPSFRPDVSREIDLVDEVGRVVGFDAIPAVVPPIVATADAGPRERLARRAREAGVAMGLSEAIPLAFTTAKELASAGAPPATVVLKNPLGEQGTVLRTSLVPGLLRAVANARRHGEHDARLFTVATTFLGSEDGGVDERLVFAAILAGARPAWLRKPEAVDVWDAKGIAEGLVRRLARPEPTVVLATTDRPACLHPRGAAWIDVDGRRVGSLGPLHPDTADAFEVGADVVLVEIDLLALAAIDAPPARFSSLPRFPSSRRDLAVVVKDGVPGGDVERAVRKATGDLGESVALFDRFVGGAVPPGHASLALHVVYRAPDRTLTDAEVDQRHARVVAEVEKEFGAQLRT